MIDIGETVRFGYYSQQGLEFDDSMRVIDVVTAIAEQVELGDGRRMSASQLLQHFLFTPETQYNYVARLSGGERRRLYLCTVLMQSPNFLVLDEPTNDLDIVTLGILEEYLQAFRGCVIVVSHDRYFVDKVADHLLVFCGGGRNQGFCGDILGIRGLEARIRSGTPHRSRTGRPKPQAAKTQAAEAVPRKLSFNEKRELEALETEIPALEAEKAALEASLSSGTLPVEELTAQSRRIAGADRVDRRKDDALAGAERAVRAGILSGGTACGRAGRRPRSEKTALAEARHESVQIRLPFYIQQREVFQHGLLRATRWMYSACSAGNPACSRSGRACRRSW